MSANGVRLMPWQWQAEFEAWIDEVQASALLASPYMTQATIKTVTDRWAKRGIAASVEVQLFTDLSSEAVWRGSLEPSALLFFVKRDSSHHREVVASASREGLCRWKHRVRNAQQYLKRRGKIRFDGLRWSIV